MQKKLLFPNIAVLSVVLLSFSTGSSLGQSLQNSNGPAEFPPSSYQGKQFVDSKGCAYIRAGYSGRVTWIPRVSRSRKLLCGFRPTFENHVAENKSDTTIERPTAIAKKSLTKPLNEITNVKTVSRTIESKPLPKINKRSVPVPQVKTTDKLIAPCVGASPLSSKYINSGAGVRCGSQENGFQRKVIREEISPQSRNSLEPKQSRRLAGNVVTQQRQTNAFNPPSGYRAVHKDGRLNALRGVGTSSGDQQMALVWSNTVPRYLIDPLTGKPVK